MKKILSIFGWLIILLYVIGHEIWCFLRKNMPGPKDIINCMCDTFEIKLWWKFQKKQKMQKGQKGLSIWKALIVFPSLIGGAIAFLISGALGIIGLLILTVIWVISNIIIAGIVLYAWIKKYIQSQEKKEWNSLCLQREIETLKSSLPIRLFSSAWSASDCKWSFFYF